MASDINNIAVSIILDVMKLINIDIADKICMRDLFVMD